MRRGAAAPARSARGDRLKQLRAFCETARCGSISRAAERLGSSQPAVSMHVRALEDELGATLFDRRGPRIALTRVGSSLYHAAVPVVEGLLRLPALFAEERDGIAPRWLRIGAGEISAAYLLPGLLERFQARHPAVRIEVRTGTGPERLEWLRRFELDAALGVVDTGLPGIEFHPLRTSTMVLVTPPDHPLAGRGPVEPKALNRLEFIAPTPAQHARGLQDTLLRVHGVTPRVRIEVDGWGAILNHVASGSGVAFVPDIAVAASERVATVAVNARPVQRIYGIAVRHERLMSLAARRFLESAFAEPSGGGG